MAGHHRDLPAVQLFDACQIFLLFGRAEAHRRTIGTGTGGASDAVDIGLRHFGQVVVKNMRQFADINATGGDIGRDQNLSLAGLEALEGGDARSLALVAVDGRCRDALFRQVTGDFIRAVLGAAEDQCVLHRRIQVLDEPGQQELLVALLDKIQALVDALDRAGHRVDLDECRVVQDASRQLLDFLRHGRAEHQVLPFCRQFGNYFLDVVDKAHVEHPVGLVQNKNFNVRQIDQTLTDQIVQSARAGDQNFHALLDGFDLRPLTHTAKDDGAAQFQVFAVCSKAFADLERKFPGRGQDEGADGPLFPGRSCRQPVEHRQSECCRLAGAGLGAAH